MAGPAIRLEGLASLPGEDDLHRLTEAEKVVYNGDLPPDAAFLAPPTAQVMAEAEDGADSDGVVHLRVGGGEDRGGRVLVTRPRERSEELIRLIRQAGLRPIPFPLGRRLAPRDPAPFEAALERMEEYAWIVFTSRSGVEAFFERGSPGAARLAAIGPGTAAALRELGRPADLVPDTSGGDALAEALAERMEECDLALLARAEVADPDLPEGLRRRGVGFDEVAVYRTEGVVPASEGALKRLLAARRVEVLTFHSAGTLDRFSKLFSKRLWSDVPAAVIGPKTAERARILGLSTVETAPEATDAALVRTVVTLIR